MKKSAFFALRWSISQAWSPIVTSIPIKFVKFSAVSRVYRYC